MAESVQNTSNLFESVEETVDMSAVDSALAPKAGVRALADPDIHVGFAAKPY